MRPIPILLSALLGVLAVMASGGVEARTIWRCVLGGTVSLSTAPEPGSKCTAREIPDDAVQTPNLWGEMGVFSGVLYEREQDGRLVYGTRRLPGAREYLRFTAQTPPGEPAHAGLGRVGTPRLDAWPALFRAAAKANGLDEAWLRAIAHAESGFAPTATSPKGARGVMQLMPDVIADYGVTDPDSPAQSIGAGARHLRWLLRRYGNDRTRALAAYNAGAGTVDRYDGVPPYAETRDYIDKVQALYLRYREAMGNPVERPAI